MRNIMLHDARYGYGISLAMTGIRKSPSATQPNSQQIQGSDYPGLAMMSNKRAALDVRGFLFWTTAFVARYGNLGAGFRNRSFRNGGFPNIILDGGCGWRRRTCWVRA
jgi:hypothetical protein